MPSQGDITPFNSGVRRYPSLSRSWSSPSHHGNRQRLRDTPLKMSVNLFTKSVAAPLRRCVRPMRTFTASVARRSADGSASGAKTAASRWKGSQVMAVAVAAGAIGWGVAVFGPRDWPGKRVMLFDGSASRPRYASMHEMKTVCVPLTKKYRDSFPVLASLCDIPSCSRSPYEKLAPAQI